MSTAKRSPVQFAGLRGGCSFVIPMLVTDRIYHVRAKPSIVVILFGVVLDVNFRQSEIFRREVKSRLHVFFGID